MLDTAASNAHIELYAALFELTDEELTDRLAQLGKRLHLVLANGAIKKKGDDENEKQRRKLERAGCDVHDRMCAPGFLGHNKFVVACFDDSPTMVWTGSANWMPTGLCTQLNNAVLIRNSGLATDYRNAWQRLVDAGDKKGKDLVDGNSADPSEWNLDKDPKDGSVFARFTAVRDGVDIDELKQLIADAKHNIYFAMFMPGADIYDAVIKKTNSTYVRGVTNSFPQRPKGASPDADAAEVAVQLTDGKPENIQKLRVVRPEGVANAFGKWAEEVTRKQFAAIGHSIIHSKCLVLDYGHPSVAVVTGSHNFSKTASSKNDENYLVVKGHQGLADAFLVNIFAAYDHYSWRTYVADCARRKVKPWQNLSDDPKWYQRYVRTSRRKAFLSEWF